MSEPEIYIDSIIDRLLEGEPSPSLLLSRSSKLKLINLTSFLPPSCSLLSVRGNKPGKLVELKENEIQYLCSKSREILMSQPMLLEL